MTLRQDKLAEDLTSPLQLSDLTQSADHLLPILKISQLQAVIVQARTRLLQLSKDTEEARQRVKTRTRIHRNRDNGYSKEEVQELMHLIALLEEENDQLRAISMLPVEIEKLKAELRTQEEPRQACTLQAENSRLRAQLQEAHSRLRPRASLFNPNTSGTLEFSLTIPHSAQPPSSASPPTKPKPKKPHRGPAPVRNKGYSPTFLRLAKQKHTSVPRACEDLFADSFPDDHEGTIVEFS